MKKSAILLLLILGTAIPELFAQAVPAAAPTTDASLGTILTQVLFVAMALLVIVAMLYVVRVNQMLYRQIINRDFAAAGLSPQAEGVETETFWDRMRKKYWENPVPIEKEGTIMLHHDFDGIREIDNSLPPWWINMFYITIVWAFGYMIYYHWGGNGPSSADEYVTQMVEVERIRKVALMESANQIDEANVPLITDAAQLAEGKSIYTANCVACHGALGEGGVGPNMTDEYWLHGGSISDLYKVIKYGVQEKGMQEWGSRLSPSDMQKAAAFILTMQGSNPPNGKAPQGDKYIPTPAAEAQPTPES